MRIEVWCKQKLLSMGDFMKKTTVIILIIVLFMALVLVSCSTQPKKTDSPDDDPANTSDVSSPPQGGNSGSGNIEAPDKPDPSPAPGSPTESPPDGSSGGSSGGSTDGSTGGSTDGSSGGQTDGPTATAPPANDSGIAQLAQELIGTPFSAGGDTPNGGFDNSGFIYYVLNRNGISCPRRTRDQVSIGEQITDYADLKPGDLVFFSADPESSTAQFGGIYIGGGKMVYCSSGAESVQETAITQAWYREAFVFGVSIG